MDEKMLRRIEKEKSSKFARFREVKLIKHLRLYGDNNPHY
jgi:hypothetical protein